MFFETFFLSHLSCFGAGSFLHPRSQCLGMYLCYLLFCLVSLNCFIPYKYKLRLIIGFSFFSFLLYLLIVTFKLINYFFVIIYFWGSFLFCCLLSFRGLKLLRALVCVCLYFLCCWFDCFGCCYWMCVFVYVPEIAVALR